MPPLGSHKNHAPAARHACHSKLSTPESVCCTHGSSQCPILCPSRWSLVRRVTVRLQRAWHTQGWGGENRMGWSCGRCSWTLGISNVSCAPHTIIHQMTIKRSWGRLEHRNRSTLLIMELCGSSVNMGFQRGRHHNDTFWNFLQISFPNCENLAVGGAMRLVSWYHDINIMGGT